MLMQWAWLAPGLLLAGGGNSNSDSRFGLSQRADTHSSFAVYQAASLENVAETLGDGCLKALYANITCPDVVRKFVKLAYRGSPGDKQLTDSICTTECQSSLKNWFTSVSSACAGKTLHDALPQRLGGYLYEGWNETCVRDPKTKEYCNNIIANFTVVSNITQMPRDQLCSTCYVRKLAMMQASSYSIYNQNYKEDLEYVYAQCGGTGPTSIPPSPNIVQPPTQAYCASGTRYTTKQGDTCDSIDSSANFSAASLYMGNQDLVRDCQRIPAGLSLCLPLSCATYRVKANDTCMNIEATLGLAAGSMQNYNAWLNSGCTNLVLGTDFYGKTICVSPQGGLFTGTPANPGGGPSTPTGGGGVGPGEGKGPGSDGFYRNPVAPPDGVPVANGTTRNCGKWHVVAASGDDCGSISISEGIEYNLFVLINPSLSAEGCMARLKPGTAVCVGPTPEWASGDPVTGTTMAKMTATTSASVSNTSARTTSKSTSSSTSTTKN